MAAVHALLPQTANDMRKKLQLVNLESVRARAGATKYGMNDYRRFLALIAAHEKLNPVGFGHCCFSPTPEIDQIWHAHLLDTHSYIMACTVMGATGGFVHHDPHGGDDPDVQKARREFTKEAFTKCYGGLLVYKWPPNAVDGDDDDDDDDDDEGVDGILGDAGEGEAPERSPKRPRRHELFKVFVRTLENVTHTLDVHNDTRVETVKAMLHDRGQAPVDQQRIVFAGKQLEDGRTMADYGVKEPSTLHMLLRLRGC